MDVLVDFTEKIIAWKKKKDGSPAKKKKKRRMKKGEYRDKDGKICKSTEESTDADEKAGYPPNCNDGYEEKDGKCVKVEENNKKS